MWSKTNFEDVWVFEPKVWGDHRGYFLETFKLNQFHEQTGLSTTFVQANEAKSTKGVLRGLHYQKGVYAQAKLVRVVVGEVLDVIVDLRPNSKTYGQHLSIVLNDITKKQFFVPRGFAHGYVVLSDMAIFEYQCDNYYYPAHEAGVHFADPNLNIDWILDKESLSVSEKDKLLPNFGAHQNID